MNEQDVLRIVRNMLSSVMDLIDSCGEKRASPVLLNVRNGASGFVNLLDEVIVEEVIEGGLEDLTEEGA